MLNIVEIRSDSDIVTARQQGRMLAVELGLAGTDAALVATAISELARNIVMYAGRGQILLRPAENGGRPGVNVVASDDGPGIVDIEQAMQLGYSTSGSLGLGLPGVRRLMDEFEVISEVGKGTRITVTKWKT
ncbi:MAG TPA: anti-sigma regulatory factor [Vicinamibacterales bacterium]